MGFHRSCGGGATSKLYKPVGQGRVGKELNLKKKGNIYFDFSGHKQTKPKNWNVFLCAMALTVGVGDPGGDGESMPHWLQ